MNRVQDQLICSAIMDTNKAIMLCELDDQLFVDNGKKVVSAIRSVLERDGSVEFASIYTECVDDQARLYLGVISQEPPVINYEKCLLDTKSLSEKRCCMIL